MARPCPLQICGTCGEPFVEPVSVVAALGDGLSLLELECMSCGALALAACDEATHEALDRALDAAEALMRTELRGLRAA